MRTTRGCLPYSVLHCRTAIRRRLLQRIRSTITATIRQDNIASRKYRKDVNIAILWNMQWKHSAIGLCSSNWTVNLFADYKSLKQGTANLIEYDGNTCNDGNSDEYNINSDDEIEYDGIHSNKGKCNEYNINLDEENKYDGNKCNDDKSNEFKINSDDEIEYKEIHSTMTKVTSLT
ncbi:hypothetical protein GJ496_006374 [Pomphorhynchus laevis]|nr:hypothetical protein GJ496_006374 [Pomphorhynchus laevis]